MKLRNKKNGKIAELGYIASSDGSILLQDVDTKDFTAKYCSLAELNKEWEDASEEPKGYWYIDDVGVIQIDQVLSSVINLRKFIGNYFETKEEAEKAVEKLKVWKRLKDNGFKFTNWEFRDVLDGELVIEAKLNFDNTSSIQRDLEVCFGGEE